MKAYREQLAAEKRRKRFRFEEVTYSHVWKLDLAMLIIQFAISFLYLASWWTFGFVRIPRMILDILEYHCANKIQVERRRIIFFKF